MLNSRIDTCFYIPIYKVDVLEKLLGAFDPRFAEAALLLKEVLHRFHSRLAEVVAIFIDFLPSLSNTLEHF